MDLKNVFEANGIYDVFRKKRGICGVDYEKIGCDYFIWSENTVASALGEKRRCHIRWENICPNTLGQNPSMPTSTI